MTNRRTGTVLREIVRGVQTPRAGVQSSPTKGVPEPMVLGEFAGFLTFDVRDGKLVLRRPGSPERVEMDRDKVVVVSGNTNLLAASRICTAQLDIDARDNRVIVSGLRPRRGGVVQPSR